MVVPRFLWLGATAVAIGILLTLIALETRPARRDTTTPRFDSGQPVSPILRSTQSSSIPTIDNGYTSAPISV
jgi:hypothetical protein